MDENKSLGKPVKENERENGNGQLISPALTPVEESYKLPWQNVAATGDTFETSRSSALVNDVKQAAPATPVRRHPSRARSLTLPSLAPSLSQSPKSSPRLFKVPSVALDGANDDVPKLSPAKLFELTSTPDSIPVRALTPTEEVPELPNLKNAQDSDRNDVVATEIKPAVVHSSQENITQNTFPSLSRIDSHNKQIPKDKRGSLAEDGASHRSQSGNALARPLLVTRSITAPFPDQRRHSAADRAGRTSRPVERPKIITQSLNPTDDEKPRLREAAKIPEPAQLPLPPFSIPTHLHLELSAERPSPLYIHPADSAYAPYESSRVKFERLLNFLLLPPQLEQVLLFGALTCLDAWLYTFTILPLRFVRALGILLSWFVSAIVNETRNLFSFVYFGLARIWSRRRVGAAEEKSNVAMSSSEKGTVATIPPSQLDKEVQKTPPTKPKLRTRNSKSGRHGRSTPSLLQVNHKADLLQGLLIIISCSLLMRFDASRIYHAIRGQSAMKLYVIYNVLEVFDRLFSALGQDIIECLFSAEVLERKSNGRSRVLRPFWMFLLALVYTVLHAMAFFYQVITLNVAVNSYSNALLTLLMSNQFVEIKGTVFKKIEKENLFQLTCADVVERFQLWLMLLIIALRNIVELGGLSIPSGDFAGPSSSGPSFSNATTGVPLRTFGILPNSFTILPSLVPVQVLVPFLVVLGSEMLVDWVKHAYITKFNATSPSVYGRFLDVLAKDYYSNAFGEQNLMRRLGLPVIPLACLFIRAALQTYHMFLATNVSAPISTATTVALNANATSSPVIAQIDHIFRTALGRSSFGGGSSSSSIGSMFSWTVDDVIALTTMLVFFIALYLVLLVCKLVLGMVLLRFARDRYTGMKARERAKTLLTETKRIGGYGAVELGDERRRVIYESDEKGLATMRDREMKFRDAESKVSGKGDRLDRVDRYSMVAKRIW